MGPEEAEAIREAVVAAEGATAGEIVPVLLSAADSYEVAYWKAATLGCFVAELVALLVWRLREAWTPAVGTVLLPGLAGALVAALAVLLVPRLRPLIAGAEKVSERTARRAREAFLAYELFRTVDRSGILLCVFRLERRVVVLADSGIHAVASEGTWKQLADETAARMRTDGSGPALLAAVRRCAEILQERGLRRRPDDRNELGDELRGDFR